MTSKVFIESKQDIEVLKNVLYEFTSISLLARLLVGQSVHKGPGDKKFLYWDPNIFDFCLHDFGP